MTGSMSSSSFPKLDQQRIRHRWEVLDAEDKAIREHRQKRKEAKSKEERELIGQWEPERMENGETMPQIMARSRHIILKHKSRWNEQQKIRARILFTKFPDLEKAYGLFLKFVDIFNEKASAGVARLNLARWYNEVEAFGNNEFNKVPGDLRDHHNNQLFRAKAHKCLGRILQCKNQGVQNTVPGSRRHKVLYVQTGHTILLTSPPLPPTGKNPLTAIIPYYAPQKKCQTCEFAYISGQKEDIKCLI